MNKTFLGKKMTREEKQLLDIINAKLDEVGLHLRLMTVKIHCDGSISTEFVPPIDKWKKEDLKAIAIIQEELTKYLSR